MQLLQSKSGIWEAKQVHKTVWWSIKETQGLGGGIKQFGGLLKKHGGGLHYVVTQGPLRVTRTTQFW